MRAVHLHTPKRFQKNREVSLNGEGFFEVTHNAKRPFLVHTNKLTIKVLEQYLMLKLIITTKILKPPCSRVKYRLNWKIIPKKILVLLPNEKLLVANTQSSNHTQAAGNLKEAKIEYQVINLPVVKPNEIKETAWLDNRILFTNELFEDVAKQIERKYNVQVIFENEALKNEQISGLLDKESLQDALQIIEVTTPFNYRVDGKTVYLSKKEKQN
jgi:transmembrane sensor